VTRYVWADLVGASAELIATNSRIVLLISSRNHFISPLINGGKRLLRLSWSGSAKLEAIRNGNAA
jgi:hypothetical protein